MPKITYQSANELMTGRCAKRRNVARYTRVERDLADKDLIHLVFYNQRLVTLSRDGTIQILTGAGYPSGRDRINYCLRGIGFYLCSNGCGGVQLNDGPWSDTRAQYSFAEGMTIFPDRSVTGFDPETPEAKLAAQRKAKYNYSKLSPVESLGQLHVGDVVMQEIKSHYDYSDLKAYAATGRWPKKPASTNGPYRVHRLYESNSGREKVSLATMDGKPLKFLRFVSLDSYHKHIIKNSFLSAVNQAMLAGIKHHAQEQDSQLSSAVE